MCALAFCSEVVGDVVTSHKPSGLESASPEFNPRITFRLWPADNISRLVATTSVGTSCRIPSVAGSHRQP